MIPCCLRLEIDADGKRLGGRAGSLGTHVLCADIVAVGKLDLKSQRLLVYLGGVYRESLGDHFSQY